jgi:hypothetical protein
MLERADRLRQLPAPALDAESLAAAMRWLMAILILAGLMWLVRAMLRHRMESDDENTAQESLNSETKLSRKLSNLFAKALPSRRAQQHFEKDDSISGSNEYLSRGVDQSD